jgi:hypothetical protein
VCALLASRNPRLACEPDPCADSCVTTYTELVAANAACGSGYLNLLACGATKPADSWSCLTILTVNIPVPPNTAEPDGCQTEFTAFSNVIIANFATCGAVLAG